MSNTCKQVIDIFIKYENNFYIRPHSVLGWKISIPSRWATNLCT